MTKPLCAICHAPGKSEQVTPAGTLLREANYLSKGRMGALSEAVPGTGLVNAALDWRKAGNCRPLIERGSFQLLPTATVIWCDPHGAKLNLCHVSSSLTTNHSLLELQGFCKKMLAHHRNWSGWVFIEKAPERTWMSPL